MAIMDMSPPAPTFKIEDLPRQDGRVIIVTGGYSGIGEETVRVMLTKGAKVYIAGRSKSRAEGAIKRLLNKTGVEKENLEFLELDLSNVKSSKEAAQRFLKLEKRLDVLVNNAGVMSPPNGSKTSDGYELQFGTNVLGHFAFTQPLLPLLEATVALNAPGKVRIVHVSSSGNQFSPPEGIRLDDDKKQGTNEGILGTSRYRDYGQSKLGNILIAKHLAKLHPTLVSLSLHPGAIRSELQRHTPTLQVLTNYLLHPVELGALTSLYAALSDDIRLEDSGKYLRPWARFDDKIKKSALHPKAKDVALEDKLWKWCEEQVTKY